MKGSPLLLSGLEIGEMGCEGLRDAARSELASPEVREGVQPRHQRLQ
ncbi:MAG: hypothetical protein MRY81_11235 [Donghicola eburneus]|jgi:hypothetical protein|nr:hypothetical protein [Donghicola eburneus]MCI5040245.1 hypothetical protein [Donghicola eburneus]